MTSCNHGNDIHTMMSRQSCDWSNVHLFSFFLPLLLLLHSLLPYLILLLPSLHLLSSLSSFPPSYLLFLPSSLPSSSHLSHLLTSHPTVLQWWLCDRLGEAHEREGRSPARGTNLVHLAGSAGWSVLPPLCPRHSS